MTIGPTFGDELVAAGLGGLPIGWSESGGIISGLEALPEAQQTAVLAVLAAHDAARRPVGTVSKVAIIRRLQAAGKFNAALTALKADPLLYELWSAMLEIRSDDANARALFTAVGADPAVILAPETP